MALSPRYQTNLGNGLLGYDDGLARYGDPQELAFQRSFAVNPAWFTRAPNPGGLLTGDPNAAPAAQPQGGLLGPAEAGGGGNSMDAAAPRGGDGTGSLGGFDASFGGMMNPYNAPTNLAYAGMLAGGLTGIPGLGLAGGGLGGMMAANQAGQDFTSAYGTPEINYGSAAINGATGGLLGTDGLQQGIDGYQGLSGTNLNDAALGAFAGGPASYSGPKGVVGPAGNDGGNGSPSGDMGDFGYDGGMDNGENDLDPGDAGDGSSGGGDKIVCTAMNAAYGFGGFRQKIWLSQSAGLHPAYQKGYHAIFRPLLRIAYSRKTFPARMLRKTLEHIARRRTADIWAQKRGRRDWIGAAERAVLEPLCYIVGRAIG